MDAYAQAQWPSWVYSGLADPFAPYQQLPDYSAYLADSMETYETHHNRHLLHHQMSRTNESKPRLSKEEVEVLEAEFQKNHKPSTSTKKALAKSMRVDNARINNWFQNRRAREKKENNIREYEAKQRMEKARSESAPCQPAQFGRQRDLVASSAPFPEPRIKGRDTTAESALSPSTNSIAHTDNTGEANALYQIDSPLSPAFVASEPDDSLERLTNLDDPTIPKQNLNDMESSPHMGKTLSDCIGMSGSDIGNNVLHNPQSLMPMTSAPNQLFGDYQILASNPTTQDMDCLDQAFPTVVLPQTPPVVDDAQLQSPRSLEASSRRSRRPTSLAISPASSLPFYSTVDMDNSVDQASPIRRIVSATSPAAAPKTAATPRSPRYDGKSNGPFQCCPSPHSMALSGSGAPPTPDTPAALHQRAMVDAAVSYSLESKYMTSDLHLQDSTLSTPPTTPGFVDGLFNVGSAYELPISDESLMAPGGLTRIPESLKMPQAAAVDVQGYLAGANIGGPSRGDAGLLPSQMGAAYFGFTRGTPDFDWTQAASAGNSRPGYCPPATGYVNLVGVGFDPAG